MKRIDWVDSTRYIAIFHVVFIHTLSMFYPALLSLWVTPPTAYIPFLLNAKVAVLYFCVLLGFFAAKPRPFSGSGFAEYVIKRYIQFAFFLFAVSVVYTLGSYAVTWLFHTPDEYAYRVICDGARYNLIYVLRDSFLFECSYNPTMWSMQQFFIASVVCRLMGCASYKLRPTVSAGIYALIVAALLVTGSEYLSWVAFCVMGGLARLLVENIDSFRLLEKRSARISLVVLAWFLYKFPMPECTLVFFMMAPASIILIAVMHASPAVHGALAHPPLPALGKLAFGVYVIHTPLNSLIRSSIQPIMASVLPVPITTLICFALCICLATACAWLLDRAYSRMTALLFPQKLTV